MSCRSTKGGSLSLRLARLYSGLPEKQVQALFHALQREGKGLPEPTISEFKRWRARQRALMEHADMSPRMRDQCEKDFFRSTTEEPSGKLFHAWSRIELRSRQEAVLQEVTTAIDLDPPGSQMEHYSLDEDGKPTKVWYASYGSNMHKKRFMTYIEGGKVEGTGSTHVGARDKTPPEEDIPIRFDGRMHFAYASPKWGYGGVAFMDVDHAGHALGRAYLVSGEQFEDIIAQENGKSPTGISHIDYPELILEGSTSIDRNLYGTLIHIGDYKCAPVVTFTGNFTAREALLEANDWESQKTSYTFIAANEPSGNYLRMIAAGLEETFGMSDTQQADYLRGCGGAEEWNRRALLSALRAPEPEPLPPPPKPTTATSNTRTPTFSSYSASSPYRETSSNWNDFQFGVNAHTPSYHYKPCPLCGVAGHSMHDCKYVRKIEEEVEYSREKTQKKNKRKKT